MKTFSSMTAVFITAVTLMATTPTYAEDMTSWTSAVVQKIAKKQTYPRSALSREIEGRAKVRITVDADGTITSHEVVEATGQKVLDREIPKLVDRLNPLPAVPNGEVTTLVLPLNWSLN